MRFKHYRMSIAVAMSLIGITMSAAKVNSERTIDVNGKQRKYVLYVPDNVKENAPLVFSLHGAAGHDTDRSPFRTSVADSQGCIVVYPQGVDQYFPVFGGYIPGWNSTGELNEEHDFFKAIIDAVDTQYGIDRQRVYCCGFSNGGMMTYANTSAAADIFAAFASISGFQLNEFHLRTTGCRPVPLLHIHGKADDFVKYSCMPIIRDMMVARNGCNPIPEVTVVNGRYTKSVYAAGEGGFPYIYYEIDGMGHNDYTGNTEDGNSAMTMWRFMSQYTLSDPCDTTLCWRLNIDTEGFNPKEHNWKVSADGTRYEFGRPKKANNADNNVYPSLQFGAGTYVLRLSTEGDASHKVYVKIETLEGGEVLMSKAGAVGGVVEMPFAVDDWQQYKITIVKESADDKFTLIEFKKTASLTDPVNSEDSELPELEPQPEQGYLIEIPQSDGREYDTFQRTQHEVTTATDSKGNEVTVNKYTATGDLQIAFKMMNIDVTDCDYVVVKFARPVAAGWQLAFWEGTDLTAVPEGSTEYVFDLEPSMLATHRLPQICMMTFFGGYTAPLEAYVLGVYKHSTLTEGIVDVTASIGDAHAIYNLGGIRVDEMTRPGIYIIDGNKVIKR